MREYIETDRLVLRKPVLADADAFATQINHPLITRMTCTLPYPYFPLAAEFWIMEHRSKWDRGIGYAYCILNENGEFVGIMDLFKNGQSDFEIGYWIGKDHWGCGYATEAGRAVTNEAFSCLGPDYIDAGYYEDNEGSARVLGKIGFIPKNEFSHYYSVTRGRADRGIELRLWRNTGTNAQAILEQASRL